jgi:hypothetical protein
MSLYEVLVVVALACVGGFAYYLYRKDTQPGADGRPAKASDESANTPMFARRDNTKTDKKS